MYNIQFTNRARKDIRKLDRPVRNRILSAIGLLENNPRPAATEPLTGTEHPKWRLRVGDWRVVYNLEEVAKTITIIRIRHRREVYKKR